MREQIYTWCEQTYLEKVGKRDVECLSWFEATTLVPKRVIFLVGREETTRTEARVEETGLCLAHSSPLFLAVSLHHCLWLFLDPVIILKYCVPVFSVTLFASAPLYSIPACMVQSLEPEQNAKERDTQSFHSRIL